MYQVVALGICHQVTGRVQKRYAIRQREANEEIENGGDGPVRDNLDKSIYLTFFPYGSNFQKSKTRMHCKNHDCAEHEKQYIATVLETCRH